MKVFISWSKTKSMHFALATKSFLECINPNIEVFVSEVDIKAGEDVQEKIIKKIKECDKLVLCFTKDNKRSPWLLFEAGYARGIKKNVIPLLFDKDPIWHSWVDNPMNIAREISFNNPNFVQALFTAFSIPHTKANDNKAKKYIQTIIEIKEKFREVDIQCEDFVDLLIHNEAFVVENPFFRDRTAYFLTGFESFDLYKAIIESFMYTGKYLWIYGRKNMKLFSGNFKYFFKYLEEKTYDHNTFKVEDFPFVFFTVDECRNMLLRGNVEIMHEVASDGLAELMEERINSLSDESYSQYLKYHFYCCEKPEMLGRSNHLLFVGKK